jgi:hypothetical protein
MNMETVGTWGDWCEDVRSLNPLKRQTMDSVVQWIMKDVLSGIGIRLQPKCNGDIRSWDIKQQLLPGSKGIVNETLMQALALKIAKQTIGLSAKIRKKRVSGSSQLCS